ncbi:MAG: hypothetical protein OHK93_004424 [Ramalina farinacea]|uniref:Uncharacterized protein n=1 Tax=Ramalina farinacea TaxID=258253 RepID=A0AA43QUD7_9LECA|nr:hypothetical protein [Ramalina farinacea]
MPPEYEDALEKENFELEGGDWTTINVNGRTLSKGVNLFAPEQDSITCVYTDKNHNGNQPHDRLEWSQVISQVYQKLAHASYFPLPKSSGFAPSKRIPEILAEDRASTKVKQQQEEMPQTSSANGIYSLDSSSATRYLRDPLPTLKAKGDAFAILVQDSASRMASRHPGETMMLGEKAGAQGVSELIWMATSQVSGIKKKKTKGAMISRGEIKEKWMAKSWEEKIIKSLPRWTRMYVRPRKVRMRQFKTRRVKTRRVMTRRVRIRRVRTRRVIRQGQKPVAPGEDTDRNNSLVADKVEEDYFAAFM